MQHAAIDNETRFAFEQLYVYDAKGRPVVVAVLQATFAILEDPTGAPTTHRLELLEEQPAVNLAGERWEPTADDALSPDPEPAEAGVVSYRVEPCTAFMKPATDVVLVGHAQAPAKDTRRMRVGLKVGPLEKLAIVVGDRFWERRDEEIVASEAQPFERIPLRYERAFGGWDRSHTDADQHHAYAANPLGMSYRKVEDDDEPELGLRLPNIESPDSPIERYGQVVAPTGFGFLLPGWEPRSTLAGTYDEAWMDSRMPYLAEDFDPRFFNAASPGLVADGYLKGNEPVAVFGTHAGPPMLFALPGLKASKCTVERVGAEDVVKEMAMDTVIIDTDVQQVTLLFRAHVVLRDGPRDVRGFRLAQ